MRALYIHGDLSDSPYPSTRITYHHKRMVGIRLYTSSPVRLPTTDKEHDFEARHGIKGRSRRIARSSEPESAPHRLVADPTSRSTDRYVRRE